MTQQDRDPFCAHTHTHFRMSVFPLQFHAQAMNDVADAWTHSKRSAMVAVLLLSTNDLQIGFAVGAEAYAFRCRATTFLML